MAPKVQGKLGMTKAAKKAARRLSGGGNRKRDKAGQRQSYHSQFNKAKGLLPMNNRLLGFVQPTEAELDLAVSLNLMERAGAGKGR